MSAPGPKFVWLYHFQIFPEWPEKLGTAPAMDLFTENDNIQR